MSAKLRQHPTKCENEKGSVMVMTVIAMATIFLLLGLAIDVARIYQVRAELQNAADAAALSAARELNSGTTGITNAANAAVSGSLTNTYSLKKINVTIDQNTGVEFAVNLNNPDPNGRTYVSYQTYNSFSQADKEAFAKDVRFVRVTTQAGSTNILFTVGLLGSSHSQTRTATAGMSVGLNRICDFFPVAVALTDPNPAPGSIMTLNFVQGSGNSATLSNLDYIILEVPDINGNGAPETAVLSAGVTNACASIGEDVTFHMTPSANINNGPVQITDGTNTRFDIQANGYGNAFSATLPDGTLVFKPDINIYQSTSPAPDILFSQYLQNNPTQAPTHTGATLRRILIVPVIDLPGPAPSTTTYSPPRTPIARFAAMFLRRRIADPQSPCSQAGNICAKLEVEWVENNLVLGRGSYDPNGTPGDPSLTLPVLYK
jgi:Flp pilus assembly protein TadG